MSTANPGLYVLPRPKRGLSALLLHLRRAARRAAGWLLRQARRALSALGANRALAWFATHLVLREGSTFTSR